MSLYDLEVFCNIYIVNKQKFLLEKDYNKIEDKYIDLYTLYCSKNYKQDNKKDYEVTCADVHNKLKGNLYFDILEYIIFRINDLLYLDD